MPIPDVRIRKEDFGYILAFATGKIGFYTDDVAPLLIRGVGYDELEAHRLVNLPVSDQFHLSAPLIVWFEITRGCNLP